MNYDHWKHPINKWVKQRSRVVLRYVCLHGAMFLLSADLMALLMPEIGHLLEPCHELAYRTGGVLAVAMVYVEV